ncbi:hypothetical protein DFJ77DRAFT_224145 [Powellomyces hirtus]|nr:hypothetical protein DFJ77DRAFT_224145 [Powellomyces hirtus]
MAPALLNLIVRQLAHATEAATEPERDLKNNVVQSNQALILNGQPVYELERVKDMMLRTAAVTLLGAITIAWALTFKNKRSAVSLLVAAFIVAELLAILVTMLPKIGILPNSPILSVGVGVGLFMFSSECFNWVLYLRFSIVSPFARKLRVATLIWLTIETGLAIANYVYWVQQGIAEDGDTSRANDLYYYLSIIQAFTALYLSSYFVVTYYYPHLKLTRRGASLATRFFTTGLSYLFLETLLHCSYSVTSQLIPTLRTGTTNCLTAIRYGIFILFVLALREDMARSQGSAPPSHFEPERKNSNGSAEGDGNKKKNILHNLHLRHQQLVRGQEHRQPHFNQKGTFDDWHIEEQHAEDPDLQYAHHPAAPAPSFSRGDGRGGEYRGDGRREPRGSRM